MVDEFFEKNPHFASYLGLHDPYDHLLPKGDTEHILQNSKLLQNSVKTMKDTINFDDLNPENQIDWEKKAVIRGRFKERIILEEVK